MARIADLKPPAKATWPTGTGRGCFNALIVALSMLSALPTRAEPNMGDLSVICDRAALNAAARTGVPISVLKAISLTETGRKRNGRFRPWPWTVNMEGKGVWFDSRAEARAYVDTHFARGARSFDVGCFQINYKWHHQNFASLGDMFEPDKNALYAAQYLAELFAEKGNWNAAAGAYHSRTKKYADRYTARFQKFRAAFLAEDDRPVRLTMAATPATTPRKPRVNTFPLLQAGLGGGNALGSLVPLNGPSGARHLLLDPAQDSG